MFSRGTHKHTFIHRIHMHINGFNFQPENVSISNVNSTLNGRKRKEEKHRGKTPTTTALHENMFNNEATTTKNEEIIISVLFCLSTNLILISVNSIWRLVSPANALLHITRVTRLFLFYFRLASSRFLFFLLLLLLLLVVPRVTDTDHVCIRVFRSP